MCEFFSAIVTRDHRVLFTEEDSHETVIARAGLRDKALHGRAWVRVELRPDGPEGWQPVRVDEKTTPGWWNPVTDGDRVRVVADRVRAVRATYHAACVAARAPYAAACAAALAPYHAAEAAALAPYAAALAAALAPYAAACAAARAPYDTAEAAALAPYAAACAAALAPYETVIRTMDGYVPSEHTHAS